MYQIMPRSGFALGHTPLQDTQRQGKRRRSPGWAAPEAGA
ncbi:hypothetical protein GFS31_20780 [Leptolyngbya sp. BL0902]|nr:hypothetical protein GFS31_20780 [Leptolyngbya sp. BL0902]